MLIQQRMISASVLASVLVTSTLIFIGILFVISLWDSELQLSSAYFFREQQKAHLASAVVRYCQDTALNTGFQEDTSLLLFPEITASEVKFEKKRWGLYEMLILTAGREKICRLLGKATESSFRAALYIPDQQRTLSISGKSRIEGKLCLGKKGIVYARIRGEFFSGTPIGLSCIHPSREFLPAPAPGVIGYVRELFRQNEEKWPGAEMSGTATFAGPVLFRRVGQEIRGINLTGPYVLYAADSVYIRKDNQLKGVIVIAGKVRIEKDFQGCMQVFARDSILLEERVVLQPGSGLWVNGEHSGRFVHLGKECQVNGYVVVMGNTQKPEPPVSHYFQPSGSCVRGLVYVNGTADIQGMIKGSLYAGELCHFAPEGYYSDLLYDLSVYRSPETVYPIFMEGPAERREVK